MNILMIEDNHSVCEMMAMFLKKQNWQYEFAYDGVEAEEKFNAAPDKWDVILLDLNLPKKDGMQVAANIRRVSPTVPLIMLTARDTESDQVLGLEIGADDYVTKPFSAITLIARIKALYRRSQLAKQPAEQPGTADRDFDVKTKKPRQVFTREQLLQLVWDYEYYGDERTVDAHIKKLRQKLEDLGPQVIKTVWGVGYKFDDEAD